MTNLTSESATRTNKRRRMNDNDGAQCGKSARCASSARTVIATADAANYPHQLLGLRLEPIMEVQVSQPKRLQTNIIRSLNLMLNQLATINLCQSNIPCFYNLVLDTKHGNVLTDGEGVPLKFVPTSCRSKCPITASNNLKDDHRMLAVLLAAEMDHEE